MANINVANFFSNKSIKKSYLFDAWLSLPFLQSITRHPEFNNFKTYINSFLKEEDLDGNFGGFKLQSHHVKSFTIPDVTFNKTATKYGPFAKSTAGMAFDGFEVKLELEEDSSGSIKRFIQYLQARIVHKSGIFWPIDFTNLPYIQIDILEEDGLTVQTSHKFHECFLLNASEATFSYNEATAIGYSLTFNANYQTTENNPR